jgi:hypothetical protein
MKAPLRRSLSLSLSLLISASKKVSDLSTKVQSFIRGNIEKLKEQALKELELENDDIP